jgi:hypothetical protein
LSDVREQEEVKMRRGYIAAILILTLPLTMLMEGLQAAAVDPATWYGEANGVLKSGYFLLYPYQTQDLKIGYSKFGEKINPLTTPARGLQYNGPVTADPATSGADPFANPGVAQSQWIEGWWLSVTYQHRTLGWRTLWAYAMFSDFAEWGSPLDGDYASGRVQGGWIRFPRTTDPVTAAGMDPHGGRKTNARVVTEGLKELYKGPRRYIALVSHTLYDSNVKKDGGSWAADEGPGEAVVQFNILIEFNRVKKYVIQKKDVKLLLDDKTMSGDKAWLELRNSGQWDLGTTVHHRSYAHFWTATSGEGALTTEYGQEYHKPSAETLYGMQWPGLASQWSKYAKAQIISSVTNYVGWAAFWPHPSYWSVDGFTAPFAKWGRDLSGQWPVGWNTPKQWRVNDMAVEPEIPFVGGEWDFIFSLSQNILQFRGITTYGVTDLNDGKDLHKPGDGANALDKEVMYQNNEVFNPYDLNDAVHIATSRKVQFFSGDGWTRIFDLTETPIDPGSAIWDMYCSFAERILVGGALHKRVSAFPGTGQYTLTGRRIEFGVAPPPGTNNIKVLYSTLPTGVGSWEWVTVGKEAATIDASGAAMVCEAFRSLRNIEVVMAGLDISDIVHGPNAAYLFHRFTVGGGTRADYRDETGRSKLLDDFCGTYAIDSSSMIHVGGPLANLGAEYVNEFLPVFYGVQGTFWYTDPMYRNRIVAAYCGGMRSYAGRGYAVIGVYKDINGAVHMVIWGATGQDTYYATVWFWRGMKGFVDSDGDGIQDPGEPSISGPGLTWLETENRGVLSIILYFDYSKHVTSLNFVIINERIGTISEIGSHS